jgi:hypothetical protein
MQHICEYVILIVMYVCWEWSVQVQSFMGRIFQHLNSRIRATVACLPAVPFSVQAAQLYQRQEEIYSRQETKEVDPKQMLCSTSVMLHIVAETLL